MSEIWVNINEGYQVSNLGNVKSLPREKYNAIGRNYSKKGRLLKFGTRKDGYYIVNISGFGNKRTWKVHQLVALHFIPNLNNYPMINHINGVKTDNRVCNLEWCTAKQNTRHAFNVLKIKPTTMWGSENPASKKVVNLSNGKEYPTINAAAADIGLKSCTLSAMLAGRNRNKTNMQFV